MQNIRMTMYRDAKIADSTRPAVFLDRDGIINMKMAEGEYVTHWSGFTFLPGVFEAIRLFNANDRLVIVVTNQQCIGKGLVTMEAIETIHTKMTGSLEENGSHVDGIYVCPHLASDGCSCRKPGTGLFEMALKDFRKRGISIDMSNSYMIGDSATDILAGERAGLRTILLASDYHPAACLHGAGLLDAARRIVGDTRARRMAM
ncbi:MAG: HAD family hydrolase [Syntrophorhabdaceae bacterium]|nr:HAD family hydrolase [Syntrophorhabdaceae bacterium]